MYLQYKPYVAGTYIWACVWTLCRYTFYGFPLAPIHLMQLVDMLWIWCCLLLLVLLPCFGSELPVRNMWMYAVLISMCVWFFCFLFNSCHCYLACVWPSCCFRVSLYIIWCVFYISSVWFVLVAPSFILGFAMLFHFYTIIWFLVRIHTCNHAWSMCRRQQKSERLAFSNKHLRPNIYTNGYK